MSEMWVATWGPFPAIGWLRDTLGAVVGEEIACEGVTIAEADRTTISAVRARLRRTSSTFEVGTVVVLSSPDAEAVLALGERWISLAGGALLDGEGEILAKRAAPKRGAASKRSPRVKSLDLSIPDAVLAGFAAEKADTELHPRREPRVSSAALASALPEPRPAVGHSRFVPWETTTLGSVTLRRRGAHFSLELLYAGLSHGHGPEVDEATWTSVLQFLCGLARATDGVLVRSRGLPDERRVDFSPELPLPASLTPPVVASPPPAGYGAILPRIITAGTGRMIVTGHRVRILWRVGERAGEDVVEVGPPLLEPLNGTKVGAKIVLTVISPRNLGAGVPPCPDAPSVDLELELLAIV